MGLRKWLSVALGVGPGRPAVDAGIGQLGAHGDILQFRFYDDGRFTLNGNVVELCDLLGPIKSTASRGGAAWIWREGGDLSVTQMGKVAQEITRANLRLAFSNDEKFSGMPLPERGDAVRPSNAFIYSSDEEVRQYVGNTTELFVYFSNLQLRFDMYSGGRHDSGIFHIVGALRPGASRIWFLHPGTENDEYYRPLVESLESQPLPAVRDGVVAFLISNKRPLAPGENPQFEIVSPDEWTEVPKRLEKDMSVSEILDVVWPAERR